MKVVWTYTNRFTEAAAGGGNDTVTIAPQAGSILELNTLMVTLCDAAAGRTTSISFVDEDGALQAGGAGTSLDNQFVALPNIGTTLGANNVTDTRGIKVIGDGSYIRILASALAQNEYFDVKITGELKGTATAPTITHTSSGTPSTGTPSQNEVTLVLET